MALGDLDGRLEVHEPHDLGQHALRLDQDPALLLGQLFERLGGHERGRLAHRPLAGRTRLLAVATVATAATAASAAAAWFVVVPFADREVCGGRRLGCLVVAATGTPGQCDRGEQCHDESGRAVLDGLARHVFPLVRCAPPARIPPYRSVPGRRASAGTGTMSLCQQPR